MYFTQSQICQKQTTTTNNNVSAKPILQHTYNTTTKRHHHHHHQKTRTQSSHPTTKFFLTDHPISVLIKGRKRPSNITDRRPKQTSSGMYRIRNRVQNASFRRFFNAVNGLLVLRWVLRLSCRRRRSARRSARRNVHRATHPQRRCKLKQTIRFTTVFDTAVLKRRSMTVVHR